MKDYLLLPTSRLHFRVMIPSDAQRIFDIYSDQEAMKYRGNKALETMAGAEDFIQQGIKREDTQWSFRQAAVRTDSNELIGTVLLTYHHQEDAFVIGYSLEKKHWGQGFASEMVKGIIKTLRGKDSQVTLKAWTKQGNIASAKVLEKNGFQETAQQENPSVFLYTLN